jgi:hypothetical protein
MKTLFSFISFLFLSINLSAQYIQMGNLNEFGKGNYYVHVKREIDAKRLIIEKLKLNEISPKKLEFYGGKSLYFASYYVNPLNTEFVYVINCLRTRNGWDIWFYYIENRYRYFYDITEFDGRYPVIYDPAVLESRDITPTKD